MTAPDFKKLSSDILRNVTAPSANRELARASIEAALREAYQAGRSDRTLTPGRATSSGRSNLPPASAAPTSTGVSTPPCAHEWEDQFINGKTLSPRCTKCGIFQSEVQDKCDHYFVPTGKGEVCVACRKPKGRT